MSITNNLPRSRQAAFPHVYAKLGYDALRDFAPVSTLCVVQFVLVVGPLVPGDVKSVADFIGWCSANPGLANYGSPGEGTRPPFNGRELGAFGRAADDTRPIQRRPFCSTGSSGRPARQLCHGRSNALPNIQSGRLRALAIASPKRSPILPTVPTIREAGDPAAEGVEWFQLFVPAGTPAPVIGGLNTAVRNALQSEPFKDALAKQAFEPGGGTPEELAQIVKSDTEQWAKVVKEFGFKPMD